MTYTETEMTKTSIVNDLRNGTWKVIFTKADGSKRTMLCTLKEDIIAPFIKASEEHKKQMLAEGKEVKVKPENDETISVIDLEKNAWRSFRVDSVRKMIQV